MTKQAECAYAENVDQAHLYAKPFNDHRALRDFSTALGLFQERLAPGASILDMGCGPGWTSLLLSRGGFAVHGVDIAERMIAIGANGRQTKDGR